MGCRCIIEELAQLGHRRLVAPQAGLCTQDVAVKVTLFAGEGGVIKLPSAVPLAFNVTRLQ
jgi:hypothetical protein